MLAVQRREWSGDPTEREMALRRARVLSPGQATTLPSLLPLPQPSLSLCIPVPPNTKGCHIVLNSPVNPIALLRELALCTCEGRASGANSNGDFELHA